MEIDLIDVPYDSGYRDQRMGMGATQLVEQAIQPRLDALGADVRRKDVRADSDFPTEIASAFALHAAIGDAVSGSIAENRFPLIVSGNCNYAAVGAIAGLRGAETAVLWLDAHADCETPETTESVFLDGMGLAMLLNRCWQAPLSAVPGFRPVPGSRIALAGSRQLADSERALLAEEEVLLLPPDALTASRGAADMLETCFERWGSEGVKSLYIHVDLDVLDPEVALANGYAEPGGWTAEQVCDVIAAAASRLPLAVAALTAYDPTCDPRRRMLPAASAIAETVIASR